MRRSFLSLTLISSLALTLGACNDDEPQPEKPQPQTQVEKPATQASPSQDMTPKEALANMKRDALSVVDKAGELAKTAQKETQEALTNLASTLSIGDAKRGAKVFKKCKSCHNVTAGAKNKVGPNLFGIIGRVPGTYDGFKYSKSMQSYGAPWTADSISAYIANPTAFLKKETDSPSAKSKMTFKLKDEQSRLDVAAYLAQIGG
ncbi:Cytochrome c-550 (modular protein) [Candidatus Terasakiella magnetica]|uniref:Cytochrome c-550 (Modular protein) n=1 Tax=Candidatus Terasakiella magnetica TaxID=1867952 RepID=A0A1C3RJR3_9PROT|nr:c-type cytochrome [Candidatus Terasakiella magnetica]SCA57491.1 Cytochrome c-550 (modular protein) [Candidatus Terasakiella magnetica]